MRTYTSLHYHVVFATFGRNPCLDIKWRKELFKYMGGVIRGLGCFPQGNGGHLDHVHLLFGMKTDQVLSSIIREVKKASSIWLKENVRLNNFKWQEGYGAFTVGYRERDQIKQYIANQEQHHRKVSFLEEIVRFYEDAGVEYDPKYLA